MKRVACLVAAALLAAASTARAQDAVKIGILNDQSGNYAEFGGLGSVEAAKLAIEAPNRNSRTDISIFISHPAPDTGSSPLQSAQRILRLTSPALGTRTYSLC